MGQMLTVKCLQDQLDCLISFLCHILTIKQPKLQTEELTHQISVLAKARKGGVDYLYSVLLGYVDVPDGVTLDEGVYYNKFMYGNKIKMPKPLEDDLLE